MNLALIDLFFIGFCYLLILFIIANITEKGWIPDRVVQHPVTYILSLGVFASAWAFYGIVGLTNQYGYSMLAYYLGVGGMFLFAPLVLIPLHRITRLHQLHSLADVMAFRFRSPRAGAYTTTFLLLGTLPLLAVQIQAVAHTMHFLTSDLPVFGPLDEKTVNLHTTARDALAFVFCIVLIVFAILYGSGRQTHKGLVTAMAFESLVKLVAILTIGIYAVTQVFSGIDGLDSWLVMHPSSSERLYSTILDTSSHTLLLIFFSSAVTLPHMFHMGFSEYTPVRSLSMTSWAIPLFLFLLSIPVLPILWAGIRLESPLPPEYFTLGVAIESAKPWLVTLVFTGGLSAASGVMIVMTLAIATMCLNHLILPIYRPGARSNIYGWLLWLRRALIVMIILAGYGFYNLLEGRESLSDLVIVAYSELLQFLPGVLAVLYWPGANGKGYMAGLMAGTLVWIFSLLIPLLSGQEQIYYVPYLNIRLNTGMENWDLAAMAALSVNITIFTAVSLLTKTSKDEQRAAEACSIDDLNRPVRRELSARSPREFKRRLATSLGKETAAKEVDRALIDLNLPQDESRPYSLRRLRDRIEANLSGLMGPAVAHDLVERLIPYKETTTGSDIEDIYFIENRLTEYRTHLTGLAAELDNLRLYHRRTLQELPLGVCTLGRDGEILMWNNAMADLTSVHEDDVIGSHLSYLNDPWRSLIRDFSLNSQTMNQKVKLETSTHPRWISLHKSGSNSSRESDNGSLVILVEDVTETQLLEEELIHSERLASIGRLAAGVAHEIGNPVTGIACLAQNLQYESEPEEIGTTAEQILGQTDRITRIVQSLVNFSRSGNNQQEWEAVELHLCVSEATALLALNKEKTEVQFVNNVSEDLEAWGDSQRLLQVFVNLLSNARDASEPNAAITVDAAAQDDSIRITVTDEGSGIPSEQLERIFDPFYTTKEIGEGTGLGLSLVYSIIEDHHGHIHFESPADESTNRGTRVVIDLPRNLENGHNA